MCCVCTCVCLVAPLILWQLWVLQNCSEEAQPLCDLTFSFSTAQHRDQPALTCLWKCAISKNTSLPVCLHVATAALPHGPAGWFRQSLCPTYLKMLCPAHASCCHVAGRMTAVSTVSAMKSNDLRMSTCVWLPRNMPHAGPDETVFYWDQFWAMAYSMAQSPLQGPLQGRPGRALASSDTLFTTAETVVALNYLAIN